MATPLPEFVFETVGDLIVMLHTRKSPTDTEWGALVDHLASITRAQRPLPAGLTLTDGGGPTHAQRAALQKMLDVNQLKTAVVSGASSVRFIVSTLALLSENIRTFPLSGVDDGLIWLGLSPTARLELRRGLARMSRVAGAERFETLRAVVGTGRG